MIQPNIFLDISEIFKHRRLEIYLLAYQREAGLKILKVPFSHY